MTRKLRKLNFIQYSIEYINIKTHVIVRKIIHTVLHIDYEVSQSTSTAYLRIRVTRIRVSRGLTVHVNHCCVWM
jgi:hypothetical protein